MTEFDPETVAHIRRARGKFSAMAITYGLGVFNDSFFRNSAILLIIAGGTSGGEGLVMAVFTVPYILFASYAGWMADRFPKRNIVISTKALELAAMICGGIGFFTGNWIMIYTMVFMMGFQSCLFSPALNGTIPELYPECYVNQANAILKVVVTVMILAGVALSGPALDVTGSWRDVPMGRITVACAAIVISLLGVFFSLLVPKRPAADPRAGFPVSGPASTIVELRRILSDRKLATVVAADVFVWFTGTMLVLLISAFAIKQLDYSKSMASYLVAAQTIGVAAGGLLSSRLARGERIGRALVAGAIGMGIAICLVATVPLLPVSTQKGALFGLLTISGVFGGLILVPCEAFIQIRPDPGKKGTVIASANFAIFCGIMLAGPLEMLIISYIKPNLCFALTGGLSFIAAAWLAVRFRARAEAGRD
jgi:MFS family permease